MDVYLPREISRRASFAALAAPLFALSGAAALFSTSTSRQRRSQVSIPQQPLEPNYVELNGSEGIIFEREGYPAIAARLYIDTNTSQDQYHSTKLQLISLLDVGPFKLSFARRLGLTDRISPIIVRSDIVDDLTTISRGYECDTYSGSITANLESMLTSDGAIPEEMPPNYNIVISNEPDSLLITSYTDSGDTINEFTVTSPNQIKAYGDWMNTRLIHPYAEIQITEEDGNLTTDRTHLSYLKNNPDGNLTVSK